MTQRIDAEGKDRVGLFVDYENIRFGLQDGYGAERIELELSTRLREMAEQYGRVVLANAYGDWTADSHTARDFRRQQIQPRLVLSENGSASRPDLSMSLDALETLLERPEIGVYVLATGDADFQELTLRLKRANRTVVVCGLESHTSYDLRSAADRFVPLEAIIGLKLGQPLKRIDFSMYDWAPLIQLVDGLERNMPFVGLGWLLKKKLNSENSGCQTTQEKQQVMDRAVEDGIVVLHKVDNIEDAADPVTACRLNREHPLVKEFVGA